MGLNSDIQDALEADSVNHNEQARDDSPQDYIMTFNICCSELNKDQRVIQPKIP